MNTIRHIHHSTASHIQGELLAALGTETNPAQWMQFMATVRQHLPDVLSRGRPTKAAIQHSVIGALGFSSWREMCEADPASGGLGLNWSQWRQWSRAWSVVQQQPGLEGVQLTAAQTNKLASDCKAAGEPLPASSDELETLQERLAQKQANDRAATQSGLRERIKELETQLEQSELAAAEYHATVVEISARLDAANQASYAHARRHQSELQQKGRLLRAAERRVFQMQGELRESQKSLAAAQQQLDHMTRQRDKAEQTLQEQKQQSLKTQQELEQELNRYRGRGVLARLAAVFSGP